VRNASPWTVFFLNVLLFSLWSYLMFLACITVKKSTFNPERAMYLPKTWEQNGKWYSKNLKINEWKDRLPQHIGKDGFSKAHLTDLSLEYLDEFIMETCRGEWDHRMCCLYAVISLLINPFLFGLLFALIPLLINLPFIAIQRYNRFRLQTLRKRLLREKARALRAHDAVTA
jgi:glycosyl-4,4'-diaponeurosporenoate acyltransferase